MSEFYELYEPVILGAGFSGLYFPSMEKYIPNRKWMIKLFKFFPIFSIFFVPFYLASQIKYLIFDEANVLEKLFSVGMVCFGLLSTFTVFSFYNNRKNYLRLIEMWETFFADDLYPQERQEQMRKSSRRTNWWPKILLPFSFSAMFLYSIVRLMKEDKDVGHPTGIPYRHQSPDFELVVTFEMIVAIFGYIILVSYDSIVMIFLSLETLQLKHLKNSLKRILESISVTEDGNVVLTAASDERGNHEPKAANPIQQIFEDAESKIRFWIIHHQRLIRFHQEFNAIYGTQISLKNIIFLLTMTSTCFLIAKKCLSAVELGSAMLFIIQTYSLSYINITFADSIEELEYSLFGEAFDTSWHLYPSTIKSTLLIILLRTQQHLKIMTLKVYTLNSRTIIKMLSAVYSLLTFLLQVTAENS